MRICLAGLARAWTGWQVQGARGAGTVSHPAGDVVRDVREGRARDGGRGRKPGGRGFRSADVVGVAVGGWAAGRGGRVEGSVDRAGRRLDAGRSSLTAERSGPGRALVRPGLASGPGSRSSLSARSAKVQRCRSPRRRGSHVGLSVGGRQVASQWRGSLSKRQQCGPLRAQVGVSGSGHGTAARVASRAEVGQERKSSRGRGRAGRGWLRRRGPGSGVQVPGEAVVDDLDRLRSRWCRPVANRSHQSEAGPRSVAESVADLARLESRRSRKTGGGVGRGGQVLGPGLGGSGRLVRGRCPGGGPRVAWLRQGVGVGLGPWGCGWVRVDGYIRAGVGVGVTGTRGGAWRAGV